MPLQGILQDQIPKENAIIVMPDHITIFSPTRRVEIWVEKEKQEIIPLPRRGRTDASVVVMLTPAHHIPMYHIFYFVPFSHL